MSICSLPLPVARLPHTRHQWERACRRAAAAADPERGADIGPDIIQAMRFSAIGQPAASVQYRLRLLSLLRAAVYSSDDRVAGTVGRGRPQPTEAADRETGPRVTHQQDMVMPMHVLRGLREA